MKSDYKRALDYFSYATQIYEKTLPPNHPKLINQLVNIAQTFGEENRKEDALKYLRQALALQQTTPSDVPVNIAATLDILALTSFFEDDQENTFELTQRALEAKRTYLTEDHPYIANDLTTLANILKEQEQYDEAMVNYMQALSIYDKLSPYGHPQAAIILHGIGFIYQTNGDSETALSYYRKAQTIYQRHFSVGNSDFIRLLLCIAEVHQLQGELLFAIESLKNCLTTIQKYCPINDPLLRKTYMMLADAYMLQENVAEALHAYEKGFSIEVDDEIEHFVYHIGYRLLMLSCTLESGGKLQHARNMRKNASIIFQTYDSHALFSLVERLLDLRGNDGNNDETCSSLHDLHAKASIATPNVTEILEKYSGSEASSIEGRYSIIRIKYYYHSMYLYQQLLIDAKQRAAAATLLACNYEKRHQYELARHYYEKACTFYRQLIIDASATMDIDYLKTMIDDICARIIHLTIQSYIRNFFFLWAV
jgi:tetratricopeptide (TPR) repeat protein